MNENMVKAHEAERRLSLAWERHGWTQMEPLLRLGRALADPMRLRILGLLMDRPMYGGEIAAALGVTPPTISRHLGILSTARLVQERRENNYHYFSLNLDGLAACAELLTPAYLHNLAESPTGSQTPAHPSEDELREMAQIALFDGERLLSLPRKVSLRRFVLEKIGTDFTWGRIYSEPEVNTLLARRFEDVASLRRALIDDQILMRDHGRYWLARPVEPAADGAESV
jgi:ArsR family transcriptional regulator, arsenate/arsenite/antimonite-responsive transcriptional repressor